LLFDFVLFSRYFWKGEIEEATEILLVSEDGAKEVLLMQRMSKTKAFSWVPTEN
jgi:uncharacterized protein involved in tolerance to divalent cations